MKYNRMNAAKTTILETSLDGAPEDMKFIGYKDIEEYTKKSYVSVRYSRLLSMRISMAYVMSTIIQRTRRMVVVRI